jgi:hypothetical protein
MNIWDRLGDLAKGTRDWGLDIGLAIGSLPKFAWDIATAPWNDRKEYDNFAGTLKQAGTDLAKNALRPVGGVIGAVTAINRNIIREPLSAFMLATADTKSASPVIAWKKAWEARNQISFGQAAATNIFGAFSLVPDALKPDFANSNFDIYDKKQRDAAFNDSIYGKGISGSLDTAAWLFGDVSIVGGKAFAAYKAADAAEVAIKAIREVRSGIPVTSDVAKKYDKLAEDFANNDTLWAANHPWVKNSNNRASVAYFLGVTQNKDEALNTMLAVLGDSSGAHELELLSRPDLAAPLRIASGELTRSDYKFLLNQEAAMKAATTEDMLQFAFRSEEEIQADKAYIAAWAKHDKYADGIFNISQEAPVSEGIGRFGQSVGSLMAGGRTVPFHSRQVGDATVEMYQPTVWHKLYYSVTWPARLRPSGMANLNDGDSIQEVISVTDRLVQLSRPSVKGQTGVLTTLPEGTFTRENAAGFIERYASAVTPEARAKVINDLEYVGYNVLAKKHGVTSEDAAKLFDYHNQLRSGRLTEARDNGFIYDHVLDQMVKVPMFESQTANILPIANFDKIDAVLKQNASALRSVSGSLHETINTVSDLWKASVLLRLGYPIRNAIDSQLRIWATVGAMTSLRHAGEGARDIMDNTKVAGTRLIDNYKGIKTPDYNVLKKELHVSGAGLASAQKEISRLEKQLALNPEDIDLMNQLVIAQRKLVEHTALYESNSAAMAKIEASRVRSNKKHIGQSDIDFESSIDSIDGITYTAHGAFGGPNGGLFRKLNSSAQTFSNLLEDTAGLYGKNLSAKGIGMVRPEDANYYQAWADAINNVFGNSKVARALMSGKDRATVIKELAADAELRARMGIRRSEVEDYVDTTQRFLDNYIPNGYGIREEILGPYAKVKSKFPYLQKYLDGGSGGLVGSRDTVGFVKVEALKDMPGNALSNTEGIDALRKSIRKGMGFATREFNGKPYQDPIMVVYDNETGLAYIGEGNHRLQAAIAEGLDAVPVRVVKGNADEMVAKGGRKPKQIKNGKTPEFVDSYGPNAGKVRDPEYVPPTMHPSRVFDPEFIVNPNAMEGSRVSEEFLRNAITDPSKLPIVHGPLLDANINLRPKAIIRQFTNTMFKYLGQLPEDNWARHPLFIDLYQKSMQKRIATAEFLHGGKFTRSEWADIQYKLEASARADAMKGVKEILYNVEYRSNAAHMLRFISPFFSAQENAVKTWLKIAADKPQMLNRANVIWNAPNRLGMITDQNGNTVDSSKPLNPNDTMWFPIPKTLKKLPILGAGLSSLDQVGVSKKSLDVMFAGNPFGVSVGPFAAIPIANVLKVKPEWSSVVSFAFPFGPDASIVNQFLPTWARHGSEILKGQNSDAYAKTYQLIWLTEQHKARDEGKPYLTDKEIKTKTDAFYKMRMAASLILPFAPQFDSPYRLYMDKWRNYGNLYGLNADAKFLQDYPDFFDFATTLSKNPTGSQATMDSVQNAKRYSSLISNIATDNPSLVGLVTNGSNAAKFDPTAYWWQQETSIGPGTPEKFRGKSNPQEAQALNKQREGWAKYRIAMTIIDNRLKDRGLTSLTQHGAEDLLAAKQAVISSLSSEIDPVTKQPTGQVSAWYQDYKDVDGTKTARTVDGFRKILSDKTFMADNANDPTWKSLAMYMKVRDQIAVTLSGRNTSNIDAKSNADLKSVLEYYISQLKNGDIQFSTIYDRYLSQDKIYDKYLGLGA